MPDFTINRFGGLRLDIEPDEVGPAQAVDLLNVDLDKTGGVRSRDGSSKFTAAPAATAYRSCHARWNGDVLASRDATIDALKIGGGVTSQAITAATYSYADIGTASAFYTYIAGADRLKRWDGTAWASPGTGPDAGLIAVMPTSGRLVAANIPNFPPVGSTATAGNSLIHFSDPAAPDTWGPTNWDLLTPGDGWIISGMVAWNNLLFVFKNDKFFVFYGESEDALGAPIFDYRTVDTGIGATQYQIWAQPVTVGPDGVYFIGNDWRLYRTVGGPPVAISGPIDAALRNTLGPFAQLHGPQISVGFSGLTYADGRLIINYSYSGAGSMVQLVYDIAGGYWLYWDLPARTFAPTVYNLHHSHPFLYCSTVDNNVRWLDRTVATDDGTDIASRYRSGFYSITGDPAQESAIRESIIDGSGSPSYSVSRDFGAVPTSGGGAKAAVTLGTAPAIAQGRHRIAQRGRRFSYQLEATSGAWRVESIAQVVNNTRASGEKTT